MPDDPIKDALNMMPYGFYVVTSRSGDDVNAMVANWITQASFEPRLVAMGLQKTSYTHGLVEKGRVFAINILRQGDEEYLMPFTKGRSKSPDKMKEAKYTEAPETGCPIIEGTAAYIELEVQELIDIGGDHDILVGKPVGAKVLKPSEPDEVMTLPYIGWSYAG
ncbi:MAG: flavin reductase family protein [Candidatus Promineifilaceae bacterium]